MVGINRRIFLVGFRFIIISVLISSFMVQIGIFVASFQDQESSRDQELPSLRGYNVSKTFSKYLGEFAKNFRDENSEIDAGSGSSIKFAVGESNATHTWIPDPTNQTDGYYILNDAGYVELNSSRGQTVRHWYNTSSTEYSFQSDLLVNKTGVIEGTDWVTAEEYPIRFIIRLTDGSISFSDNLTQIENYFSTLDNSTIWGVGIEGFGGVMAFYMNFQDTEWGHSQYLYYPRLLNGQITAYNQPLYAIYPHLYAKLGGTWYDKILNDRSLYAGVVDPRNTLHFDIVNDTFRLWFDTYGITILGRTWDFQHGFKYNLTDQRFHQITEFRCRDQDFEDIGMAYEITSSPQSDGTPYQPNGFILANETNSLRVNISQAWEAGTYLEDFYSSVKIISQNNESFTFLFSDMEQAGFTQKYLSLHNQSFPSGEYRFVLRAGMYGYGNYINGTVILIDPEVYESMETDSRDFYVKYTGSYSANIIDDEMIMGKSGSDPYYGFIAFDTGLTTSIKSVTSAYINLTCNGENVESDDNIIWGVYDDGTTDEYWTESEADADDQGAFDQSCYYSESGVSFDGENGNEVQMTATTLAGEWMDHHNGDPSNRQYFPLKIMNDSDWAIGDWFRVYESTYGSNYAYISITYTVNNAPSAPTLNTDSGNTYAGKSHTIKTDHTDVDGDTDIDLMYIQYYYSAYNITLSCPQATSSGSVTVVVGSGYVVGTPTYSHTTDPTNGYRVTWTISLDWDFVDDTAYTVYGRTKDDDGLYSSWTSLDTNNQAENDLEVVSATYTYPDANEYGGSAGTLEASDFFKTGSTLTITGSVEYEGSSQTYDDSYGSASVQFWWDNDDDGTLEDLGDSYDDDTISSGAFSISFTQPSGSGASYTTNANMDLTIQTIDSGGSDVTGSTPERDLYKDDAVPTITQTEEIESSNYLYAGYGTSAQGVYGSGMSIPYGYNIGGTSSDTGCGVNTITDDTSWGDNPSMSGTVSNWVFAYGVDSADNGDVTVTYTATDHVGNTATDTYDFFEDNTNPSISLDTEFESSSYLHYGYGTSAEGYYGSGMGSTEPYTIGGICSDALAGLLTLSDDTSFGDNPSNTGTLADWEFIYQIDSADNGDVTVTYTIRDNVYNSNTVTYTFYEDNTAPSDFSITITNDTTFTYYDPYSYRYHDDVNTWLNSTAKDDITESGAGLVSSCYKFQWYYSSWVDIGGWTSNNYTNWDLPPTAEGNKSVRVGIKDNVGNVAYSSEDWFFTCWDVPSSYSLTWENHLGIESGNYAYLSGSTIYFNSGVSSSFNITVNNDGSIGESGFWKIEFDKNSVFIVGKNETGGLPDEEEFAFNGDTSGTFIIRIINKAGHYQSFSYTATEDATSPTYSSFALDQDSQRKEDNWYHTTAFTTTLTSPDDAGSGLTTNYVKYSKNAVWGSWEATNNKGFTGTDQYNNTFDIKLRDYVGNENDAFAGGWCYVDTIAPVLYWLTLNETYSPNWYDQSVSSTAQAKINWLEAFPYSVEASCGLSHTDDTSPSGSTSYINFTITGVSDGSYSVSITIYDKAGNSDTTLTGSEAPIQLESGMSTEAHIVEYWFIYYRSDGKSLDWKEFNTTYVLDEDYRNYTEVLLLGVGVGKLRLNDTSSIRIITRDYFQEVIYNQSFALPLTSVKNIQLDVYTFKVASTFDGIVNMTVERTSGAGSYDEQLMPYEIFSWQLYNTTYNITGLVHTTGAYVKDDDGNTLNDYQIDLSSSDVAIFVVVINTGLCSITLVDQNSKFLEPRQFKIYQDGSRIYSDSFNWVDTTTTKNITITDIFDNQLYQALTTAYSRFLDIQLSLFSVKIINLDSAPVYINITLGSLEYSEWVFAYEIIEYELKNFTSYDIQFFYSTIASDYSVSLNGSLQSDSFTITSDTLFVVTSDDIIQIDVSVAQPQPADPIIQVYSNNTLIEQDIDAINNRMNSQSEQLSLLGSFMALILFMVGVVFLLAIFQPDRYKALKQRLEKEGIKLVEYGESKRDEIVKKW